MIDFKNIKNNLNPLNAVVTGIIVLFICIRILTNNHENAFIIETINPSESTETSETSEITKIPVTTELQQSSQATKSAEQTRTSSQTPSVEQSNKRSDATTEPLAFSAELGKSFNLDAFNKLSKDELMTFSGIGEVTAQAILDYRNEYGPFSNFNDLMLVKGIGEKKLQKIMTILP